MLSESVKLLGKGMYNTIPDVVNINAVPTASELEYIGSEDFDSTMINKIFPQVIDDSDGMDFSELLVSDYEWVCRCLRMKSYGPFVTTTRIICPACGKMSSGEYGADLRSVGVVPFPDSFVNKLTISRDEFIYVEDDIVVKLLNMSDYIQMNKDTLFRRDDGSRNASLARICYMVRQIGNNQNLTPVDVKVYINKNFGSADYEILKNAVNNLDDYGLRMSGSITCPSCGSEEAYWIAMSNDKFFRPALGDVRRFRDAVRSGEWEELPGDPSEYVR